MRSGVAGAGLRTHAHHSGATHLPQALQELSLLLFVCSHKPLLLPCRGVGVELCHQAAAFSHLRPRRSPHAVLLLLLVPALVGGRSREPAHHSIQQLHVPVLLVKLLLAHGVSGEAVRGRRLVAGIGSRVRGQRGLVYRQPLQQRPLGKRCLVVLPPRLGLNNPSVVS